MAQESQDWKARYRALLDEHDRRIAQLRSTGRSFARLLLQALRGLEGIPVDAGTLRALRIRLEAAESLEEDEAQRLDEALIATAREALSPLRRQVRDGDPDGPRAPGAALPDAGGAPPGDGALDPALRARARAFAEGLAALETGAGAEWDDLRAAVDGAGSGAALLDALLACGERLAERFRRLRAEVDAITAFLRDTSARLEAFDAFAVAEDDAGSVRRDRDAGLASALDGQVRSLESDARSSDSLGALRASVLGLGARMRDTLGRWAAETREAEARHRSRLDAARAELARARTETRALRAALERSERATRRDALTGLPNRAAFGEQLAAALDGVAEGAAAALLVLDVDHFKAVNDGHGHLAGDAVLEAFARRIERRVGNAGTVARYGGEEFVVLLADADPAGAALVAEGCRRAVAQAPFLLPDGGTLSITASVGLTTLRAGDMAEAAFGRADRALYRAKGLGRNRIVAG